MTTQKEELHFQLIFLSIIAGLLMSIGIAFSTCILTAAIISAACILVLMFEFIADDQDKRTEAALKHFYPNSWQKRNSSDLKMFQYKLVDYIQNGKLTGEYYVECKSNIHSDLE